MSQDHGGVALAYERVRGRIAAAAARAGRDPQGVALVAVTKEASGEQIRALIEEGQVDLAENRVQQLVRRMDSLAGLRPRWHMVGHLQRNKVEQVVGRVVMIHSVDSLRLAEALRAAAVRRGLERVDVLLEVNISEEGAKFGVSPGELAALAERVAELPEVRLRGLMTMAPYSERVEDARRVFARCRELYEGLRGQLGPAGVDVLSMGMSGDFEVAIEEGATVVRVGRALFAGGGAGAA